MPHIHVTCAIIERNGLVLAARRSAFMQMPLKWEFPGGKIRAGEDPGECLKREIREELTLEIDIADALSPATHHYPDFIVTLYPFICKAKTSGFKLTEHAEAAWFPPGELTGLDWAEADLPVLDAYLSLRSTEGI
ncbi:(deoxy)nucleoside triphosphate pyrophosphohydrolase [Desulfonatronospira sp.]|uniref:(deoxy)nucleoside triphosphate pyrophosphohydrolase n=1 Tax=Desulfonatronospira sp. TaxID=1962951 RepID=UPI0025C3F826|nr:(deoxy)nucleoside triphosphate pyrophosphohydrolase [Desulfonatronospira sp.]